MTSRAARAVLAVASMLLAPAAAAAQPTETSMASPDRTSEIAAIEAAVAAVYGAISGPAGQPRDFAHMRTLFTPEARLTAIGADGPSGGTLDDYIARSGKVLVESGFTERGLVNRVELYGDLAHVWSSYEGTFTRPDGSAGSVRGINSFQLVRQDGRWLVQSIFWQAEAPGRPLPHDMTGEN
jgi:hypothetical protein